MVMKLTIAQILVKPLSGVLYTNLKPSMSVIVTLSVGSLAAIFFFWIIVGGC